MSSNIGSLDASELLKILQQTFPEKGYNNKDNAINYATWKVDELKLFLKVTGQFKGLSKANKMELRSKVTNVWKGIAAESMFSTNDISDNDLVSANLNLLSPVAATKRPLSSSSSTSNTKPPPKVVVVPDTPAGLTKEDFKRWNMAQLGQYLSDRCINKTGNKEKLVDNVYGAYLLNLPVINTDYQQENAQIEEDINAKLRIENGMLTLPNPLKLVDNWIFALANLPDTTHSNVEVYLRESDAGKAYAGGEPVFIRTSEKDNGQDVES